MNYSSYSDTGDIVFGSKLQFLLALLPGAIAPWIQCYSWLCPSAKVWYFMGHSEMKQYREPEKFNSIWQYLGSNSVFLTISSGVSTTGKSNHELNFRPIFFLLLRLVQLLHSEQEAQPFVTLRYALLLVASGRHHK